VISFEALTGGQEAFQTHNHRSCLEIEVIHQDRNDSIFPLSTRSGRQQACEPDTDKIGDCITQDSANAGHQ